MNGGCDIGGFDFRSVRLASGAHEQGSSQLCVMEAVAYISGEKHSDKPGCVCPVIGAAARRINDNMTQEERDELLAPMLFDFAGTVGVREDEQKRWYIAVNYAVRVFAPFRLRLRGREDLALQLEACPKVVDEATLREVRTVTARICAAYAAAYDAADAAYAAAAAAYAAAAAAAYAYADAAAYAAASPRLPSALAALRVAGCVVGVGGGVGGGEKPASPSEARRAVMEIAVQMLRDMVAVKQAAPREWARKPSTLPCLVNV